MQSQLMTSYVIDGRVLHPQVEHDEKDTALDSGFGHDLEIMEELIFADDVLWGVEIIVKVILIDDLLELCGELFPRHRLVCIGRGRVIGVFWLATTPEHREAEMSAAMKKKFGVAGVKAGVLRRNADGNQRRDPLKYLGKVEDSN